MRRVGFVVGAVSVVLMAGGGSALAAPAPTLYPQERGSQNPVTVQHPSPERPLIAVAHRGASGHAPENTLAALNTAKRLGARTVEIDVQLTADDELVLMHDTTLERTTNATEVFPDRGSYAVGDFTLEEIERLEAGSWFDPVFEGEPVPTLGTALELLETLDLNLFLEVKEPALYPGIEDLIAEEFSARSQWLEHNPPWEPRRLIVQSFDWEAMEDSKSLLPSVPHALLGLVPEEEIAEYDWAHMINPNHTHVDADYVEAVHGAGLEITPYTLNDRTAMDTVLEMGADGFITDFPEVGLEAIRDFEGAEEDETAEEAAELAAH